MTSIYISFFFFQPFDAAASDEIHGLTVSISTKAKMAHGMLGLRKIVRIDVSYWGDSIRIEDNVVTFNTDDITAELHVPFQTDTLLIKRVTDLFYMIRIFGMWILYGYNRVYIVADQYYKDMVNFYKNYQKFSLGHQFDFFCFLS